MKPSPWICLSVWIAPSPNTQHMYYDVTIIGGGLSGLSLGCLLAQSGLKTCILEQTPMAVLQTRGHDIRTTAISAGSSQPLRQAGIWDRLLPFGCPIDQIDILDGSSPILLQFDKNEAAGQPFGWIFDNYDLRQAMYARADELADTLTILSPAKVRDFTVGADDVITHLTDGRSIRSPLVVGADGKASFTRQFMDPPTRGWSYGQQAIVCLVTHENPHNNIAVEHFRPEGPFAILPFTDRPDGRHCSAVVWTEHGAPRRSAMRLDADTFNLGLQARFPARYGRVSLLGQRAAWPLGLQHVSHYTAPRMILMAEAAHAMHPIAGQGLNMSLRDVICLHTLLTSGDYTDYGDPALLETYEAERRVDTMAMLAATDNLNRLFGNNILPLKALRRAGVAMVNRCKPIKRFFMRQAMGG